ncbi:hypothetical protein G9P44_003994 [Scheffersomyces stipitis]|nr:hypothetical protein G9P44_003994 [Scheffersomyces stipitis]
MLNFTGQTHKRVVNLGNRGRNGSGSGSKNYLEQTRIQRLQREEQRQKEKSGLLLQSYIRRHLDLSESGEKLKSEWLQNRGNFVDEEQWNLWILQFNFLAKWTLPQQPIAELSFQLKVLFEDLQLSKFDLSQRQFSQMARALTSTVERIDRRRDLDQSQKLSVDEQIIQIICFILDKFGSKYVVELPDIINYLSSFVLNTNVSQNLQAQIIELVFKFSTNSLSIWKLLTSPGLFKDIGDTKRYLERIRTSDFASEAFGAANNFDGNSLVSVLVNFLTIHTENEPFINEDLFFIASVFERISFSIHRIDEDVDEDDFEDFQSRSTEDVLVVSQNCIDTISLLYSTTFIRQIFDHFTAREDDNKLSWAALQIISTLIFFYPAAKSKLCMLITIIPNSYRRFFAQLESHEIYQKLISQTVETGKDFLIKPQIEELYTNMDAHSIGFFWKTLYTFQELYSYWLIVSNDLESFQEDKLNLKDVSQFLIFSRSLCLTLIFCNDKPDYFHQYEKLKDISISLLNQLYMKNLRLRFLPDDFWKLKVLKFNIDSLLQIIAEEEEKRIEEMDIDEDDSFQYSRRRRSSFDGTFNSIKRSKNMSSASAETLAKLEMLKKVPFFIEFKDRVRVFQSLIELDRQRNLSVGPFFDSKLGANIRREFLLEDAYNSFHKAGSNFKNRIQVSFFNEYGPEAGIDGGGITKEFLTSVVREGFDPSNELELFKETISDNQIYPNDDIHKSITVGDDPQLQQKKLSYLKFLGSIVGKCLYENVLIDVSFAPFFLNKWCNDNMKNSINDLNYLDHELFMGLMKLVKMPEQELDSLDLNFTVNETLKGKNYVFDLLPPNGENTKLNSSNKLSYIHQISNFKLNQSLHIQTKYFIEGLFGLISSSWLSMFDSFELQMLISGGQNDINILDWKNNVEYGGYLDSDITVRYFWEVVAEMTPDERFALIKFVTSVSRAPLLGFGSLNPKFGIRNSGSDTSRLPTASTCVNLLKLPDYRNKELIRSKLLYAIEAEAGFDLS